MRLIQQQQGLTNENRTVEGARRQLIGLIIVWLLIIVGVVVLFWGSRKVVRHVKARRGRTGGIAVAPHGMEL